MVYLSLSCAHFQKKSIVENIGGVDCSLHKANFERYSLSINCHQTCVQLTQRGTQQLRNSSNLKTRTLAPDPQSQSFSGDYGSIVPTPVACFTLSTRGCKPCRRDEVLGATRHRTPRMTRDSFLCSLSVYCSVLLLICFADQSNPLHHNRNTMLRRAK